MADCIFNSRAICSDYVINTSSMIKHEMDYDRVRITPNVCIGRDAMIKPCPAVLLNSNVIQNINVDSHSFIDAKSIAIKDIPTNAISVTVPSTILRSRSEGEAYL